VKVDYKKCAYSAPKQAGDEVYIWCNLEDRECWASLGNDCDCFEEDEE
jgi:hypothetical protein